MKFVWTPYAVTTFNSLFFRACEKRKRHTLECTEYCATRTHIDPFNGLFSLFFPCNWTLTAQQYFFSSFILQIVFFSVFLCSDLDTNQLFCGSFIMKLDGLFVLFYVFFFVVACLQFGIMSACNILLVNVPYIQSMMSNMT